MKKKSTAAKRTLQQILINALEDVKAQNIVTLDVRKLTDVTDTLIIASGTSNRQVRAIAQNAMEEAKKHGFPALGVEGLDAGDWVLADFADAVVHVMLPETREFYDLERLWQSHDTDNNTISNLIAESTPVRKQTTTAATAKPAAKKATGKRVAVDESPIFDSQHVAAKSRKALSKTGSTARKSPASTSATEKSGVAKAGVYAKTGTRKPAAAKPASKTTAGPKKSGAASKSTAPKPSTAKSAATKSTTAKSATAKPAATKKPAIKKTADKTSRSAIGISTAAKNKSNAAKPKKPAARKPRA